MAVVSCSEVSTTPTLNTEISKLKTQITLNSEENPYQAATAINNGLNQKEKNTVFKTYYSEVRLANGFKYNVKWASASSNKALNEIEVLMIYLLKLK